MSTSTLAIYHRSDLDGLCCEAIARKALSTEGVTYLGFEYGDTLPDLTPYRTILLMDISLPREVMAKHAGKIVWIDHHQSAIEAMADLNLSGYRIDGVAACRLAWQYLVGWLPASGDILPDKAAFVERRVTEPYAVQLLGEYDIWDKRNSYTDIFQLGMLAQAAPDWHLLLQLPDSVISGSEHVLPHYLDTILQEGRAIQAFTEVQNAKVATERGFDVQFEGLLCRALCTARSNSLTFTAALRPEHDACLSYFWDGRKWRFSLYGVPGKEHLDLSVIAGRYGGGGHKQACGGVFAILPRALGGS